MSQMSGTPDFLYSVGADTRALEKSMKDASKKSESALGSVGTAIEKNTAGARKFAGALSSTVGIVTGIAGAATFAVGAATTLYAVYEQIANSAERVAEANRRSNEETQRAIRAARSRVGLTSPMQDAVESNTSGLSDRIALLREELDDLHNQGNTFRATMLAGLRGYGSVFGFDRDPDQARILAIQEELNDLTAERRDIERRTREIVEGTAEQRLQKLNETVAVEALRARGESGLADQLERQFKHRDEIAALEKEAADFRLDGMHAEADAIDEIIAKRERLYDLQDEAQARAEAHMEAMRRQNDEMSAAALSRSLSEQKLRALGQDDLADRVRMEGERLDLMEKISALDIDESHRDMLRRQVEDLMAARSMAGSAIGAFAGGSFSDPYGASAQGTVGQTAASQILGGGSAVLRQLDEKRNTTLAKIETNTGELVRAVREGGMGMAVFA